MTAHDERPLPTVTFTTTVWEKDWRFVLSDQTYLAVRQIEHHRFPFTETLVVINNVDDRLAAERAAKSLVEQGTISSYVVAADTADEVLAYFSLARADFRVGPDSWEYEGTTPDWIYFNALGRLTALYCCHTEYLLYLTGDTSLDQPVEWIRPALAKVGAHEPYKVANPVWNDRYDDARQAAVRTDAPFLVADEGFSDQMFLVRTRDFRAPIYGEIRSDAARFPRGETFEKRAFSWMKSRVGAAHLLGGLLYP